MPSGAKLLARPGQAHFFARRIKLGQYLSSRADVMPAPFLRELARCQDSLEAVPFAQTRAIIEAELGGRPLESVFASVDESPLAVASIASVHRAVLLDGRHVVVKVQHAAVRSQLLLDLRCLETICDAVKWLDSDFDLSPLVREWAKEVPKELDFQLEAANMVRVAANLAPFFRTGDALSIDVRLATVVAGLTSQRLLVMTYVDGFKPTDMDAVAAHGADKEVIMRHITRAYAQQIFGDGLYSGDPHPGNILVDRHDVHTPVLLDFGLTKALTESEKYHFSKLIVAADEADIHGLLVSMEGVGLRLRTDVPFDVALLQKYFFRDAAPAAEAKRENAQRREQWRAEAEARRRTLYVGDKVSVSSANFLGWRSSRSAEVVAVLAASDAQPQLRIRLTDGGELTAPAADCKLQSSRSPIDSWPDAFIFFERVRKSPLRSVG
jgi:aarF domain-containing kinase